MIGETVAERRGRETEGEPLWSIRWHGWRKEYGPAGEVVAEDGQSCELRVMAEGNWVVCGGDGCVVVRDDDPDRFARLAVCLLGRGAGERWMSGGQDGGPGDGDRAS